MSDQDAQEQDGVEKEPEPEKIILEKQQIIDGLSQLQRTPDGSSFAYSFLNVEEKDPQIQELVNVNKGEKYGQCPLEDYKYLRVLNLGKNAFTNIDKIICLKYLYELNAPQNQITSLDFLTDSAYLQFIQKVDLTGNKITMLPNISVQNLSKLILDENEINKCDIISNSSLKVLSLNKNKLVNCEGIKNLTSLEELSITENETLVSLKGLSNLPSLKKLILNGSKVANLKEFPDLPQLEVLSLEGNAISSLIDLKRIGHLKNLKELNMTGCPISDEKADEFKKEVLIELMHRLKQLKKINGDGWEPELVAEVNAEKLQRQRDKEKANLPPALKAILEGIEGVWGNYDPDATGSIDKENCIKLAQEVIAAAGLNPREDIEEAYEALFINFDKNGAGTVEKGDLLYLIKDLVTE